MDILEHIKYSGKAMHMNRQRFDEIKGLIRRIEGLVEVTILSVTYYLIWRALYFNNSFPTYFGNGKFVLMLVYATLVFILFFLCDSFKYGHLKVADIVTSQFISIFIVDFVTYFQLCLIANVMISPWPILLVYAADMAICLLCSWLFDLIYHRIYVPRNMVMIYGNDNAVTLKIKMDTRTDKYRVDSIISINSAIEEIYKAIDDHDAVVINDVSAEQRNDVLKYCYEHKVRAYVVPKLSDIIIRGGQDINLFDTPMLLVKGHALTVSQRFVKRAMDILICGVAMIPAAPIMLLIALAIKIEDHGPVFYKQKRVTRDGKVFEILKFRSMIVDAEKGGYSIPATGKDPRITKVGHITRATRIDELPQLINILKGDMSIVGPRPERTEHVEKFTAEIPEFAYRLKVKGGLTGYAQIYGKYNTNAYDKLRLDLMYIENYSILLDIKLILMTLRIMLKKESTEGFDALENLEKQKKELLDEISDAVQDKAS